MNDYKITAHAAATGDDLTRIITERTEKAARLTFSRINKGTPHEITGSELVKENTTATKQQERDALAKIRAMVEELGPDSYLAAAFAGCFEIADQNIEYDFGDSMKARAESANRDAEKAQKELAAANSRIAELESNKENADAACLALQRQLEDLREDSRKAKLPRDLYDNLHKMVLEAIDGAKDSMAYYADMMADATPESEGFYIAVAKYKADRERLTYRDSVLTALEKIEPKV